MIKEERVIAGKTRTKSALSAASSPEEEDGDAERN